MFSVQQARKRKRLTPASWIHVHMRHGQTHNWSPSTHAPFKASDGGFVLLSSMSRGAFDVHAAVVNTQKEPRGCSGMRHTSTRQAFACLCMWCKHATPNSWLLFTCNACAEQPRQMHASLPSYSYTMPPLKQHCKHMSDRHQLPQELPWKLLGKQA